MSVKREGGRWHVVPACDQVLARPLDSTGAVVGIDMDVIASFLTTGDGTHIPDPRHGRTSAEATATARRKPAKSPRRRAADRTKKHRRAAAEVFRSHRKIARRRLDHAHKTESAGRAVVPVNPRNTSRTCPDCGHTAAENNKRQEEFRCVACSFTEHADVVGATNILRAGPALYDAAEVSWEARRFSDGWSHGS